MRRKKVGDETSGEDDAGLFRRLMADAKPILHDKVTPPPRSSRPEASFTRRDQREVMRETLEFDRHAGESMGGESVRFRHPSVSRSTMRRLARGGFCVEAAIDLHGMTGMQAKAALQDFVADSLDHGYTCVRIVHGKGYGSGQRGPVLKRAIDGWLRHFKPVLAYVSARPVDGGTGAVYVLLRRSS